MTAAGGVTSSASPRRLFIELVLLFVLLDVVLVALLEVLGQHDVAVLAHRLHPRLATHNTQPASPPVFIVNRRVS